MTNGQPSIAPTGSSSLVKHKQHTSEKAGADGAEKQSFENVLKSKTSKAEEKSETKNDGKIEIKNEANKKNKSGDEETALENGDGVLHIIQPRKEIGQRSSIKLENHKGDNKEPDDVSSSDPDLKVQRPAQNALFEPTAKDGSAVSDTTRPLLKESAGEHLKRENKPSTTNVRLEKNRIAEKPDEFQLQLQSPQRGEAPMITNAPERMIPNKPKLAINPTSLAVLQNAYFTFRGEGTSTDISVRDQIMDRVSPELKAMQRINMVATGMQAVQSPSATNIISLQLHPIGLGRLQAHLHKQDGALKVDLVVESKHTLDVLNADINGLKSSLRALGVLDQNINITLSQNQTARDWQSADQSNFGFDHRDSQQAQGQDKNPQGNAGRPTVDAKMELDSLQSVRHPIYGGNRLLI